MGTRGVKGCPSNVRTIGGTSSSRKQRERHFNGFGSRERWPLNPSKLFSGMRQPADQFRVRGKLIELRPGRFRPGDQTL
jgi:hypothetical protein